MKIIEHNGGYLTFHCPACDQYVNINRTWNFNNDYDNPTISPSIITRYTTPNGTQICHSFIKDGKMEYLSDCTHEYAGQTLELPEIDENAIEFN